VAVEQGGRRAVQLTAATRQVLGIPRGAPSWRSYQLHLDGILARGLIAAITTALQELLCVIDPTGDPARPLLEAPPLLSSHSSADISSLHTGLFTRLRCRLCSARHIWCLSPRCRRTTLVALPEGPRSLDG